MVSEDMVNAAWERWIISDDRDKNTMRASLEAALRVSGEPSAQQRLDARELAPTLAEDGNNG